MVDSVGSEYSSNQSYEYLEVDPEQYRFVSPELIVKRFQKEMIDDLKFIAVESRNKIYAIAEDINDYDTELDLLDKQYKRVNLRRKRYVWIAYNRMQQPVGAAICYRGPLGLNYSFLENRCDLLIPEIYHSQMDIICSALLTKSKEAYFSPDFDHSFNQSLFFPLKYIPVVTEECVADYLKKNGAKFIRNYNQCIWLFQGYYKYYKYLEDIFKNVIVHMKLKKEHLMNEKKLYNTGPTRTFIKMIKSRYPHVDTNELYKYMGAEKTQIEDSDQWLTQEQVNLFYEKVVELTGNENIAREAGKFALESEGLGPLNRYLISLGNPAMVYKESVNFSRRLDKSAEYESIIKDNTAEIIATPKEGVKQEKFQCQNRLGNIEQVPIIFGCKLTKLEHDECIFKGGDRCHYLVQWSETAAFRLKKLRPIAFILFIVASTGLFVFAKQLSLPLISALSIAFLLFCWFVENKEKNHFKNELIQFSNIHSSYGQLLSTTSDFAELVKDIGHAISNIDGIENKIEIFLKPLKERLDFDFGMVLLSDTNKTMLKYSKGYGLSKQTENTLGNVSILLNNPATFSHYFVNSFKTKKPVVVNDFDDPSKLSEDSKVVKALNSKAFIVCPIIHNGKPWGVLAVFHADKKRDLIQRDVNVLMGLASTIGAHIVNV